MKDSKETKLSRESMAPSGSEMMSICICLLFLMGIPIMMWGPERSHASIQVLKGDSPAPKKEETPSVVIERIRRAYGMPKGLLEGLIQHESKWDEKAYTREKSLCRKKGKWTEPNCYAHGLTQIVLGYHGSRCRTDSRGLLVWKRNILCGGTYLGESYRKAHGNVRLALAYFNGDRSGRYAAKVLTAARKFGYRG